MWVNPKRRKSVEDDSDAPTGTVDGGIRWSKVVVRSIVG